MPPSPWLSARITITRYLIVTTRIMAHSISDSTPSTCDSVTAIAWCSSDSRKA